MPVCSPSILVTPINFLTLPAQNTSFEEKTMRKLIWLMGMSWFILLLIPALAQSETAATLIDNFETYTASDFAGQWWVYSDDTGSTFVASIDTEEVAEGSASLKLEVGVVPSGFAGIGYDYGLAKDWRAGTGITFKIKASAVGIPAIVVLHLKDETQTSPALPGLAPFAYRFVTPEGSDQDWVTMTLNWDGFKRLTWMGTEGIMEFTANPVSKIEIAFEATAEDPIEGTIWLDDIRVISETDLNVASSPTDLLGEIAPIQLSQIGYRPQDAKIFYSTQPVTDFAIVDDATGDEVFNGVASEWGSDPDAGATIYRGDFTALQAEGDYRVVVPDVADSYPFSISERPYDAPLLLAIRALYLQRSGMTVDDAANSGLTLDAGHTEEAVLWDDHNVTLDVSGGWYDAGDFGRYLPTQTFAVNQLVYAFTANPDVFADGSLNIPESGNGVPDLLDEIRYSTDWLLKMQREDGAVHHKVTTRSFPTYGTLPAEDTAQLFVFDVTSEDTAYFAGAMAQASRAFRPYDEAYADTLLAAAQHAWAWLEAHPEQYPAGGFQNPPVSEYPMQGGYDFVGDLVTPRLFASAELLKATGDSKYDEAFTAAFKELTAHSMSWANFYPMALYAYLTSENTNAATHAAVEAVFRADAADIADVIQSTGYNVALQHDRDGYQYLWGSNQQALAHGLYLMLANELYPDEAYPRLALHQIHYILGANPLAKAYIQGMGSNPILNPHHNVSFHFQQAVPGWIGEGANQTSSGNDSVLESLWEAGAPPAMSYIDDWNSWASNEPTVDTNATFAALLAYFAK
jgi:endoglucanase